jgi:hypothetical protein
LRQSAPQIWISDDVAHAVGQKGGERKPAAHVGWNARLFAGRSCCECAEFIETFEAQHFAAEQKRVTYGELTQKPLFKFAQ